MKKKALFFRNFIKALKSDSELDIWRDMPGIGISLYNENPYSLFEGLDYMRNVLNELGYKNLPIYVDQLGFSYLTVDGEKKKAYSNEPGIYGATWMASFLYEVFYNNSEIGNVEKGSYLAEAR